MGFDSSVSKRWLQWCNAICKMQGDCSAGNSFSPCLCFPVLPDREDPEDTKALCLFLICFLFLPASNVWARLLELLIVAVEKKLELLGVRQQCEKRRLWACLHPH